MKLKVIKPFDWAHQHVRVETFAKGQIIETDDEDLIRVATAEGWVKPDGSKSKNTSDDASAGSNAAAPGAADAPADASPQAPLAGPADAAAQPAALGAAQPDFPPADPDAKGGENNPLTMADAEADLAGTPRPA